MRKFFVGLTVAALLVGATVSATAYAHSQPAATAMADGTYTLVDVSDSRVQAIKASPEFKATFGANKLDVETAAVVNANGKAIFMATFKSGGTIVTVQKDAKGNTLSFVTAAINGKTMTMKDSVSGKTQVEDLANTHHGDLTANASRTITPESRYDRCYWSCVALCMIGSPGPWCGPLCMLQCI